MFYFHSNHIIYKALTLALLLAPILMMTACAPKIEVRGNMPSPSRLAAIKVDQSTMDEIVDSIGTPSMVATFDSYTWYYVSTTRQGYAFFEKEITEHLVLELKFGADRVLKNMRKYSKEELMDIAYLDKETPTAGREFTLWEQLFGNLGARPVDSAE